jgi:hypothetical protein
MGGESHLLIKNGRTVFDSIQQTAVNIPFDIVCQIAGWLNVGSHLTNMALVQRSWCEPVQRELFRAVILKCPIRAQLLVEAFVRNIGPGNPFKRRGAGRSPLENFVYHIYLDIPENFSQAEFYGNLATILPLLENLRSLYIVMRSWNEHVWTVQLGTDLPEHAPPSLQRLCIQVSGLYNIRVTLYSVILQIHAGIQILDCLHVSQTLISGKRGLQNGITSKQLPSSAKMCGGGDHLTSQCPRHARPQKRPYASGWLTPCCKDLSCGPVSMTLSCLHNFRWRMPNSINLTSWSPLAIDTHLNVTKQESGRCYR